VGVFDFRPVLDNRSYWSIFNPYFSDYGYFCTDSETACFTAKKTGLIIPYWMADLLTDQTCLLITRGSGERDFFGIDSMNEKEG
jgi:hypothetical protein